ncbi:hypothetical protein B566_EDAN008048 [Ephemera danica]|nr:hypothetical protein B566_EDAN008048 [Ephemera danica]
MNLIHIHTYCNSICVKMSVLNINIFTFKIMIVFCVLITSKSSNGAHLSGTWNTSDFFKFIVKFGIQKANRHNPKDSLGYIYGNITSKTNFSNPITFAVLDRGYFLEYYGNRSVENKDLACKKMFNKISRSAYDASCFDNGKDFLRKVPCEMGSLCSDEDKAGNVVNGYQFTFMIQDVVQPRFWYISLVACYRNESTCSWHHYNESANLDYNIWLVNGNPNSSHHNSLEFQFSFDRQNTLEISLLFLLCYVILVPLQVYAVLRQRHPVTRLFLASLILEMVAMFLEVLQGAKFAIDGVGMSRVEVAGDILDILSRTEVDIVEDIDEYQTWPGWIILVFRTLIMGWFLLELRYTMLHEHNAQKLNFFLHFGASALVWFIYLPIVALIALQISDLYRFKLLLGITYSADALAYCVMTHLLWPTRSEQYLLLADRGDPGDELDEFNEAPHVVNSYAGLSNGNMFSNVTPDSSPQHSLVAISA